MSANISQEVYPHVEPTPEDKARAIEAAHHAANALPICPYCKSREAMYSFREFDAGPWRCVQIFCGKADCRYLFNVQITGPSEAAMKQAMRPAESRILPPH